MAMTKVRRTGISGWAHTEQIAGTSINCTNPLHRRAARRRSGQRAGDPVVDSLDGALLRPARYRSNGSIRRQRAWKPSLTIYAIHWIAHDLTANKLNWSGSLP
jgi:hypothetical protein